MDSTPAQLHVSQVFQRRPYVSKKYLFGIILTGFALSVCQLFAFSTNPSSHILCFVDWKSLLQASFGFIRLGASLIQHSFSVAIRRYGMKRLFLSWLFILLTSYVLVTVVLEQTTLWTWDKLELTLMKKLEDNVITINETRAEFIRPQIRTGQPYKIETHSRYNGEDIRLVCENTLYFEEKVRWHHQQVIWKHNQERVESSDRYHIDTIFEELTDNETTRELSELYNIDLHIYHVVSKLEIYMIDGADYGKYSCHIAKIAFRLDPKENEPASRPSPDHEEIPEEMDECQKEPPEVMDECRCPDELYLELLRIRLGLFPYEWNAEFIVSQILPMKKVVFVPIGSIISVSASYRHLDDTPVEFDHEINEKSFGDTCESYSQSCSILMYIYWFLWHNGGHYSSLPALYMYTRHPYMDNEIGGTSWQCACPETYGTHKYIFYRKFFNRTMGTYQIISIPYPDLTEVKPQEPNILEPYFNSTKGPLLLPEPTCWGDFKTTICVYFEQFLNGIATEFFSTEKRIFFFSLVSSIILMLVLIRLTIEWITNPSINFILSSTTKHEPIENTLGGFENESKDVCYDLFISCDEGQALLADKIATHLKSHGLRVCLSDVDILGNELHTRGISRLVDQSRKYLIIVTPEYTKNRLLNNFEFQLIYQRFLDSIVSNRQIALLELTPNLIPSVLGQFTVFKFSQTMDSVAMDCVRTWLGPSLFKSDVHSVKIKHANGHTLSRTDICVLGLVCFCGMSSVFLDMFRGTLFNCG